MKIDGGCHCGEIEFEAEADLEKVGNCHCTDCQVISGSPYRSIAIVAGDTFRIKKGTPKEYVKIADSGNRRIQAFCPNCGSALYATNDGENHETYNVRVGAIKQRADLVPQFEIWRCSALPWLPESKTTKKFDKGPN